MEGLKKNSRALAIKGVRIYGEGEQGNDGCCEVCGQWTALLDVDGCCTERECKDRRIVRAIELGKAVKINGILIWTDNCEPFSKVPPKQVVETEGPVCSKCGLDYKRVGDFVCLRCRKVIGPESTRVVKVKGKGKR